MEGRRAIGKVVKCPPACRQATDSDTETGSQTAYSAAHDTLHWLPCLHSTCSDWQQPECSESCQPERQHLLAVNAAFVAAA